MMVINLMLNLILAMLFLKSINPLSMGMILIFQTLFVALLLGSMTKTFWIMYLLMLTFIGGMLVLFIYVTSIFPNEKFLFDQKSSFLLMLTLLMIFMLTNIYFTMFKFNMSFIDQTFNLPVMNKTILYTTKMFYSSTSPILIFLVLYLFFCMIVVIKITYLSKGPLRKMHYV
uniref:NADH-ubiquinone oxidoreductase chain 6 n=1 Tax=Kaestneriella sp. KaspPE TaxID=2597008 RepID=A0A8K1ZFQ7_9NEOP|nr:NADH dehydrogenase subunit 6 [Kaestneriella sp. KaspPE]